MTALAAIAAGRTVTRLHRTRFVDDELAAHQLLPVAASHGPVRRIVVVDLDEREAPRFAGLAVADDTDIVSGITLARKEIENVLFVRTIGQVAYEKPLQVALSKGPGDPFLLPALLNTEPINESLAEGN